MCLKNNQGLFYYFDTEECKGCKMINGAGYNSHPDDCGKFVKCFFDGERAVSFSFEDCPFGLFWSQDILACEYPHKVNCANDKCRHSPSRVYHYTYKGQCSAYWDCTGHEIVGKCCPSGYSYIEGRGCFVDPTCTQKCIGIDETPEPITPKPTGML